MSPEEDDGNRTGPEEGESSDLEGSKPGRDGSGRSRWARASVVIAFGAELAGFLMVGILGGMYLDGEFGTSPLFLILGLFLSLAAAGWQLWQFASQLQSDDDDGT